MGWGGKGKGPLPLGPPFHHRHHHHHGPGALAVAAEAAVVGGVTAAAVASVVARPRPRRPPLVLPPQQVVVVGSAPAPVVAAAAPPPQPVYVSEGVVVRGAAALPPKGKGKGKGKGRASAVVQQDSLDVANVCLPADAMELRASVNFFAVDVTHRDGESWRVMRRYNDFHSLNERLGSQSFPGAPFPRKQYFGCTGQKLEDRRQGLEMWLRRAIENPASGGAWLQSLKQFLEAGRLTLITAGAPAPTLPASSLATSMPSSYGNEARAPFAPPAAVPTAAQAIPEPATSEEEVTLEINIPTGVSAGQLLGVNVPSGQQLTVAVPEGFSAGSTLELLYDPKSNTLTPLT